MSRGRYNTSGPVKWKAQADKARELVKGGMTREQAADAMGVALSTINGYHGARYAHAVEDYDDLPDEDKWPEDKPLPELDDDDRPSIDDVVLVRSNQADAQDWGFSKSSPGTGCQFGNGNSKTFLGMLTAKMREMGLPDLSPTGGFAGIEPNDAD